MERLTIEKETKEMNTMELSQNCMYVKDGWCRYRDYNIDVGLIDFVVDISNKLGGNIITADGDYEVISEELWNNLQYGYDNIDGIIALLYTRLAALANLRRRLKEYEDLKLTPEQIREIDNLYSEQAKELGEYKNLEQQGKLPKIPCNVGDTVYTNYSMQGWYFRKENRPYSAKIVFIGLNGVDNYMNIDFENGHMLQFKFSDIGKIVFLTQAEAEETLKRTEDENGGRHCVMG